MKDGDDRNNRLQGNPPMENEKRKATNPFLFFVEIQSTSKLLFDVHNR
jgi:hypothetical protein